MYFMSTVYFVLLVLFMLNIKVIKIKDVFSSNLKILITKLRSQNLHLLEIKYQVQARDIYNECMIPCVLFLFFRNHKSFIPWTKCLPSLYKMTDLKLVGVCRPERKPFDRFIPSAIKVKTSVHA